MSRRLFGCVALWGALCVSGAQPAFAQGWVPFGGAGCGACAAPQIPTSICGGYSCAPPVQQVSCGPQYVQVPVTEMRACKQIVQKPVYETKYVEQPITQYRTEYETRVANVPTMQYQTVTECQTRTRDAGRWVTNYRCRPFLDPCAVDGRPGLFGTLNRSLYQARMALTPAVVAERSYVPNYVTEQIPITRQVAIPGTRQVSYQVSKVVPYTTKQTVAVQTMRMVAQEITTQHPVTVYRTVPAGSAMAINPGGYAPSAIATPDPISRSAINTPGNGLNISPATPVPARTSNGLEDDGDKIPGGGGPGRTGTRSATNPRGGASVTIPQNSEVAQADFAAPIVREAAYRGPAVAPTSNSTPSIVRVARWSGASPTVLAAKSPVTQITVAQK